MGISQSRRILTETSTCSLRTCREKQSAWCGNSRPRKGLWTSTHTYSFIHLPMNVLPLISHINSHQPHLMVYIVPEGAHALSQRCFWRCTPPFVYSSPVPTIKTEENSLLHSEPLPPHHLSMEGSYSLLGKLLN